MWVSFLNFYKYKTDWRNMFGKNLDRLRGLIDGDAGLEQALNAIALTSFIIGASIGALLTLGVMYN